MKNYTKKNPKETPVAATKSLSAGIIYFFSKNEEAKSSLEQIASSNREIPILVIGEDNTGSLSALASQGRITLFGPGKKAAVLEYLESSPVDVWVPADRSLSWNLAKGLQSIKLQGDPGFSWFRASSQNSQNKVKHSVGSLLGKLIYKKLNAFFSPSIEKYSEWNAFAVKKDYLLELIGRFGIHSPGRLLNQCNLLGEKAGPMEIVSPQMPSYARQAKNTVSEGLKDYFSWFFKDGWSQFRKSADYKERIQGISRLLFASFFILALFVMPILSYDYGITWDEKLQYDFAKDIYKYLVTFGEDQSVFDYSKGLWQPMQYYGSFFDVITVAFNDVFGIENEFESRHVLNSLFGVMGLLFAGLAARALTGSWLAALLTFVFLILTPSYYGHSMNNPKDVPFAVGFFMAVYYMIRFIKELPNPTFATKLLFILGCGLSISIRVGGILIFPYLLMFMGIKWLGTWVKNGQKEAFRVFGRYFVNFLIVFVLGWLAGMVFWPFGLKDPINNPITALKGLSNVNYTTSYETFEGVRTYMSQVPWYYSLKLISIGAPLIVLLGLLIQVIHIVVGGKRQFWWNAMLVFMFLFPILYAAYKHSMLYNGWRHWFFAYGNVVILAAWGWSWIIENKKIAIRYAGLAFVFLGCANMMWWMIRSHPNQYIYFNELTGGLKGAYGYYETDYYSNTLKQAAEWLCENEDVDSKAITVVTNNEPLTAQYYVNKFSDSVNVIWTREYELSKKYSDYAIFTTRTMAKSTLLGEWFPPKGTIHTIMLDGVPLCAIVKRENQFAPRAYETMEKGMLDSSIYYFRKAIDYDPHNEELYRSLGIVYLSAGPQYLDSAFKVINKSIELLPENFIAYDFLGQYYMKQNNLAEAEKNFAKSVSYKINYTNAHYNRGIVLYNSGNFVDAVKEFENSIRYGGHRAEFYKLLGMALLNLNQFDNAIKMLGDASSINPNDPEVYHYLGKAYEAKGDGNTAAKYYNQAAQFGGQ